MKQMLYFFEPFVKEIILGSNATFLLQAVTWTGRTISLVKTIPDHIQNHAKFTFVTFLIVNAIIFSSLANFLEERVENAYPERDVHEMRFNQFLIYGVVVGGGTFIFNFCLSLFTGYSLAKIALIAITCVTIALSILLRKTFGKHKTELEN